MNEVEIGDRSALMDSAGDRAAHYWRGAALNPFSFGYEAAFMRVAVDGAVEASLLLVYLLTLDARTVDRETRGEDAVMAFREKMHAWAAANGISCVMKGGRHNDATNDIVRIADEIFTEAQAARFEVQVPGGHSAAAHPNG